MYTRPGLKVSKASKGDQDSALLAAGANVYRGSTNLYVGWVQRLQRYLPEMLAL